MGPYGPIWVARGEKSNVTKVKIIISDRDFFLGLCQGDDDNGVDPECLAEHINILFFIYIYVYIYIYIY